MTCQTLEAPYHCYCITCKRQQVRATMQLRSVMKGYDLIKPNYVTLTYICRAFRGLAKPFLMNTFILLPCMLKLRKLLVILLKRKELAGYVRSIEADDLDLLTYSRAQEGMFLGTDFGELLPRVWEIIQTANTSLSRRQSYMVLQDGPLDWTKLHTTCFTVAQPYLSRDRFKGEFYAFQDPALGTS